MKTILCNGKIYIERGHFEEALYIEDGIIRAAGSNDTVRNAAGAGAEEIDCGGHTVIPGLNDSHLHLLGIGVSLSQVNLRGAGSLAEVILRTQKFLREHPDACRNGILGVGWNQDLFSDEKRIPSRHDLDKISTDIPIVLKRVCEHIASANTKAIEMMGLNAGSGPIEGGTYGRKPDGTPDGIFSEHAADFAGQIIPKPTAEEYERMFVEASDYAASVGITSVQSNDVGQFGDDYGMLISMISRVYSGGRGKVRYHPQMAFHTPEALKEYLAGAFGRFAEHPLLSSRGSLKLFKDGSLGARTALMKHEYQDDPGNFGVEVISAAQMDAFCSIADKAGMQVVTHVIGDRAVEETTAAYEKVLHNGQNPCRHGLIHCQITDRPLLERIVRDHIPVFYQPIFLDYDMHAVISRCGEELSSTSYAFRTVEDLGGCVAYGTDSPVEDCNPFPNIYSAVTRKDKNGWPECGFFPQECVDVYRAVDAYTAGSARVEFCEDRRGRLKPGFDADLTMLDKDIFTCDPMEIRGIKPLMTMVAGKVTYSA